MSTLLTTPAPVANAQIALLNETRDRTGHALGQWLFRLLKRRPATGG